MFALLYKFITSSESGSLQNIANIFIPLCKFCLVIRCEMFCVPKPVCCKERSCTSSAKRTQNVASTVPVDINNNVRNGILLEIVRITIIFFFAYLLVDGKHGYFTKDNPFKG